MEFGANEKVSMEAAAGAAMAGLYSLTSMKHVGLNVAADPLGTLTYIGVKGALVIYNADDPSLFSSQNEQDNRHYCRLFGLPLFEPSSAQEMKDMTVAAFRLSHELGMPVMLRSTTRVAHLRGVVELGEITPPRNPAHVEKDHSTVSLPVNAIRMHRELLERLEQNPMQFPVEEDLNLPSGQYRSALFAKRYKAVFMVEGSTVYLDAVLDCRQDHSNLTL